MLNGNKYWPKWAAVLISVITKPWKYAKLVQKLRKWGVERPASLPCVRDSEHYNWLAATVWMAGLFASLAIQEAELIKPMQCVVSLAGILALGGCAGPDLAGLRDSLLQTDRQLAEAVQGDDVECIMAFWSEDSHIYTGGRGVVVGKDNLRELVTRNRSIPGFSMSWEVSEAVVAKSGDSAYTLGPYQLTVPSPEGHLMTLKGNHIVIWKREDGQWRCSRKFNAPLPSAPIP